MDNSRILFTAALLWTCAGFGLYYFLSINKKIPAAIWKRRTEDGLEIRRVLLQRFWGFLFLGVIPFLALLTGTGTVRGIGLGFSFNAPPPWWAFVFLAFMVVAGFVRSRREKGGALYPQIRTLRWTKGLAAANAFSWIVFLAAYEFLFRGVLLSVSLAVLDPWPAVALNAALYGFAHFYKGPGEAFGAIPAGIIFSWITIMTGNMWTAFFIHSVMAVALEFFSLRANPDMHIISPSKGSNR